MKKTFLILLIFLLLAGCTSALPELTTEPGFLTDYDSVMEQSSAPATIPTTVPTASATEPSMEVTREPWPDDGRIPFVFDSGETWLWETYPLPGRSELVEGCLYVADTVTNQIYLVTDKQIYADPAQSSETVSTWSIQENPAYIFYVLEEEPNKLYCALRENAAQQEVIYVSEAGPITSLHIGPYQYQEDILQWVEGHRRYVWFDISSAKAEVRLELPYILAAHIDTENSIVIDGEFYLRDETKIWVYGKLHQEDELEGYIYDRETGNFEESAY